MTPEQEQLRANEARYILQHPIVADALARIKTEIVRLWADAPSRDREGKEHLWNLYKIAEKFEGILRGYIESGKIAEDQIKRKQSFSEKVRGIRL